MVCLLEILSLSSHRLFSFLSDVQYQPISGYYICQYRAQSYITNSFLSFALYIAPQLKSHEAVI